MIIQKQNIALEVLPDYLLLKSEETNSFSHSIYTPPNATPIGVTLKASNEELSILGPTRRRPTTWSDFIEIKPNTSYTKEYLLHQIFAFHGGCHDYVLRFYNGFFYPDERTYHELGFVELEFSFYSSIDYANLRVD